MRTTDELIGSYGFGGSEESKGGNELDPEAQKKTTISAIAARFGIDYTIHVLSAGDRTKWGYYYELNFVAYLNYLSMLQEME